MHITFVSPKSIYGGREYLTIKSNTFFTGNTASTRGDYMHGHFVEVKNRKELKELAEALRFQGLTDEGRV